MQQHEIIVIGAGIIGMSIALELQKRGRCVRIVDRQGVGAEFSAASAGPFAFTDIIPLATSGIVRKVPKWILDPLGPLPLPPAFALKIAPWLLRFWRASWRDRFEASTLAQARLMDHSHAILERQIIDVKGEALLQREVQMQLNEGEAEFRAGLERWDLRRKFGINFQLLESPGAIAEIQPGLASRFTHAGFTPAWMNTVDPLSWLQHVATTFLDRGGTIERAEILQVSVAEGVPQLTTLNGVITAGEVVVVAGAWSHKITASLGDRIPLETERDYNTTLPPGAFDLRTHLTFGGHGFVVSCINGEVRVGSAVELGGLSLPPNFRRADILLQKTARFLPELDTGHGRQWLGFRPSLPDSLPVIGPSSHVPQVFCAFGHGHLGLTQAAGTAELIEDILSGNPPALSIAPFSATRF